MKQETTRAGPASLVLAPQRAAGEPYTTSEIIAAGAGVQRRTVDHLLLTHKADFEEFGILRFEIAKTGGRGRPEIIYHLNEQQATLLMTYLKNTEVVRAFKKELEALSSMNCALPEMLDLNPSFLEVKAAENVFMERLNDFADEVNRGAMRPEMALGCALLNDHVTVERKPEGGLSVTHRGSWGTTAIELSDRVFEGYGWLRDGELYVLMEPNIFYAGLYAEAPLTPPFAVQTFAYLTDGVNSGPFVACAAFAVDYDGSSLVPSQLYLEPYSEFAVRN